MRPNTVKKKQLISDKKDVSMQLSNEFQWCSRKRSSIISCLLNLSTDTFVLQEKLSNLCQLLRSMDASDRKTSISTLPLKIRGALTKFMEDSGPVTMEKKKHLGSTSIRLRAVNGKDESGAICKKYSAQLDLDSLRSYTRNMVFDLALEHQMILSDLRDQLIIENADNPDIWSPPFKVGHNGCVHGLLGKIQVIGFWRIDQKPKSSLVASWLHLIARCVTSSIKSLRLIKLLQQNLGLVPLSKCVLPNGQLG